jgi:hypothetical protein
MMGNTGMNRLAVMAGVGLTLCSTTAHSAAAPATDTKGHRETLSLTGDWGFRSDQNREGDARGWGDWKYFTGTWRQVRVPITFDNCAPGMQGYRGVCWFQKQCEVPAAWRDRLWELHFRCKPLRRRQPRPDVQASGLLHREEMVPRIAEDPCFVRKRERNGAQIAVGWSGESAYAVRAMSCPPSCGRRGFSAWVRREEPNACVAGDGEPRGRRAASAPGVR